MLTRNVTTDKRLSGKEDNIRKNLDRTVHHV
jgi:hypothetical protein